VRLLETGDYLVVRVAVVGRDLNNHRTSKIPRTTI
jgi:hypothetical protein